MNNALDQENEALQLGRLCHVLGHTFFSFPLSEDSFVLDLGANNGRFSTHVNTLTNATVIAIEPTPRLYETIATGSGLMKKHYAISDHCGVADFHISSESEASGLFDVAMGVEVGRIPVPTITLDALINQFDVEHVDLVKMDIEGAERTALLDTTDETLHRFAQLTVEFHDFCGLVTDKDVERIRRRMKRLGFHEFRFSRTNMDVLFVNSQLMPLSSADVWRARVTARVTLWLEKAVRIARKKRNGL